jgi:hypothetical protein
MSLSVQKRNAFAKNTAFFFENALDNKFVDKFHLAMAMKDFYLNTPINAY